MMRILAVENVHDLIVYIREVQSAISLYLLLSLQNS